jgi:hypothetical protein
MANDAEGAGQIELAKKGSAGALTRLILVDALLIRATSV